MSDLTFIVEVILSIAAVAVPIGLILVLLVAGDYTVTDLFLAPSWDDRGHGPAPTDHEEVAPRWRLERLRRHQPATEPGDYELREDTGTVAASARVLSFEQSDR